MKIKYATKIQRLLFVLTLLLAAPVAWAIPVLQVDINGGTYIGVNANEAINESTYIGAGTFTVDAIYTAKHNAPDPAGQFYLVVGITDLAGNAVGSIGAGSINIHGTDYVDSDFSVSNVPISNSPYGPYPTLNIPIPFSFDTATTTTAYSYPTTITTYNVQDDPGDPVANPTGGSLLVTFDVDRTSLENDFLIVFDLVAYDGTFAPYSHNGVAGPDEPHEPVIPEPATLALVALGLGGLATGRIRRRKTR